MCLTKTIAWSGCGAVSMICNVNKHCGGRGKRSWVLDQPGLPMILLQISKVKQENICSFYLLTPSGATTMINAGATFYIKKLHISSLFMDSWILQIKEALMAADKKVYPNLEYHINFIIWVAKFLDSSLNNPSSNFWVTDDHFTTSYLSHYCLHPVKTI